MEEAEADLRYDRLVADLGTLSDLLASTGDSHWADWLGSARRKIVAHDGYGLRDLLGAYGGMGSFSDLSLPRSMSKLRTRVWEDASALLADLERRPPY